jgi:nicotinamide riboside transporter PnuC
MSASGWTEKRIERSVNRTPSPDHWRRRTDLASALCAKGVSGALIVEIRQRFIGGSVFVTSHLDYLSCFLTVLATILLARKSWIGLLIAIVNSLIVCAIALRTSQLGLIPANLFCICIYAFGTRSWLKERTHTNRDQRTVFTANDELRGNLARATRIGITRGE